MNTDTQTGYKGHTHKVMTTDKGVRIDPPEGPTWIDQALSAIRQGQSLNDFVAHCHESNRTMARKAYLKAQALEARSEQDGTNAARIRNAQALDEWEMGRQKHLPPFKSVKELQAHADKLAEALRILNGCAERGLDQSATHDGLSNAKAIADAREALAAYDKAKGDQ